MNIIVTGYAAKSRKFANIRVVAVDDTNNEGFDFCNRLNKLYWVKASSRLKAYNLDNENYRKVEPSNDKGPANVHFIVPYGSVEDFLKEPFLKMLTQGLCQQNGVSFTFDINNVLVQIQTPSKEEIKEANDITDDFIGDLFRKLDSTDVQQFLRNYCGTIKYVSIDMSGKGLEQVQLSQRNTIMILAQMLKNGIKPQFVCSARQWERDFNRKIKSDQINKGAYIEVPKNNKQLIKGLSQQILGIDYDEAMRNGGANRFNASWVANNHNEPATEGFYWGIVYDETQTELMVDSNGNPLPDLFNDPKQQRRVTNLGNDTTLKFPTDSYQPTSNDVQQGLASPFNSNVSKIPECLNNIIETNKYKRYNERYNSIIPDIKAALKNPTVSNMKKIVKKMAQIELYQFVNNKYEAEFDEMVKIVTNVVMSTYNLGSTFEMAQWAKNIIAQRQSYYNRNKFNRIYDACGNILTAISGGILKKEQSKPNAVAESIRFQFNNFLKRLNEI